MPRSSKGSELPLKSPKLGDCGGPSNLRTSSSHSDPLHQRPITDRSLKLGNVRSPKGSRSDPVNQKKLGTRIAGLESQLEEAQEELKTLKEQLASAEAAKKQAQLELEKKVTRPAVPEDEETLEKRSPNKTNKTANGDSDDQQETDVFEILIEKVSVESKVDICQPTEDNEVNVKFVSLSAKSTPIAEPWKPVVEQLALKKNNDTTLLMARNEEQEKAVIILQENNRLKNELDEATLKISAARVREEEMASKLNQLGEVVETSEANIVKLNNRLEEMEVAKEAMEMEMKKLRVQTEQWRKAADAAALVLAGNADMNNRSISERCGSMDKPHGYVFEPPVGGYTGLVGSPSLGEDYEDGFGKRKGSGIKMFGDLWKKKSQK